MSEKAQYQSPTVVEYGSLEELTLGSGCNGLDFIWGQADSITVGTDGHHPGFAWSCSGS